MIRRLIVLLSLFAAAACWGQEAEREVRVGVLSHRGYDSTMAAWGPTADYLSEQLPGHRFVIVPLDFHEIADAVAERRVEFVSANPGIYVTLEVRYGVSRIATLNNLRGGFPYNIFGGVIFTRAERDDLLTLEDLVGADFVAVDATSLGGYQMAWRELRQVGIEPHRDFASLEFAGTHDEVVMAVRDGHFDAGTVRTDILERMARDGMIESSEFRVIQPRSHPAFPFVHSTRLYPEWPFAKLKSTSNELAQRVAVALLDMPRDHPAGRAGRYAGWTVPLDYQPVHELFRELRIGPYSDLGKITPLEVVRQYWYWLLAAALVALAMATMLAWVGRLNNELKRAKYGLERDNAMILQAVGDGIYGVDLEGRCTFANPALERITGWSREELIGYNQHDILHHTRADGSQFPSHECPVFATFRDNTPHYVDNDIFWRKDGSSIPVEYISTPVNNERGETVGAVVVFRDVTERRRAEERMCEHQAELAHSARLSTVGEMASGIAHELNQPLAAIATYVSACTRMLRADTASRDELLEVMERVSAQAERAGGIIRQIRGFIRKEEPRWEALDINEVARQVTLLIEPESRRNRTPMRLELADGLPPVHGYSIQLEQVVLNLVRNGIEAMADLEAAERELVITTAPAAGGGVEVAVADRGHGISEEVINRLFDPFFTTKSSGMGLGLSISRAIIESHEGRLAAASRPEGGAVFSFVLPAHSGVKNDEQ